MPFARWRVHAIGSSLICAALLTACSGDDGPPDEPGTLVHLTFCTDAAPVWVAVQDGDAAWTRLLPRVTGVYEARFTASRGGVAIVSPGGNSQIVTYGNLTELASISCGTGDKILNGNVAGLASVEGADIWYGRSSISVTAQAPRFQFRNAADGQQDLFATRFTSSATGGRIANRLVVRRAQTLTSGSRIPPIDFASTESFAPAFATASISGADVAATVTLLSSWHGSASTTSVMYGTGSNPQLYSAVPEDRLQQGELSSLRAFAYSGPGARTMTEYFRMPTDRAIALGPALSTPTVTWPGAPSTYRPRLQLASQPQYGRMAYVVYARGTAATSVAMTSSYLGTTPATWDIEVPDLSSVDGWNNAWGFSSSSNVLWYAMASGGVDRLLGDAVHDGDVFRTADFNGGTEAAMQWIAIRPGPHRGGFPPSAAR